MTAREMGRRLMRLPGRQKLALVWRVLRDRRVPLGAKLVFPALAAYLATPIDIIPDFIPVLGQLDDVVVLVLGGVLLVRSVPGTVIEEHLARLEGEVREGVPRD